jgi:hypothetical protein
MLPGWHVVEGTAEHQAPDTDGTTSARIPPQNTRTRVGDVVAATVTGSAGVDLLASAGHQASSLRKTDACREVT